jgi:hypothetical protein
LYDSLWEEAGEPLMEEQEEEEEEETEGAKLAGGFSVERGVLSGSV